MAAPWKWQTGEQCAAGSPFCLDQAAVTTERRLTENPKKSRHFVYSDPPPQAKPHLTTAWHPSASRGARKDCDQCRLMGSPRGPGALCRDRERFRNSGCLGKGKSSEASLKVPFYGCIRLSCTNAGDGDIQRLMRQRLGVDGHTRRVCERNPSTPLSPVELSGTCGGALGLS